MEVNMVPEIIFSEEQKKPLKIGNQEYFSANDFSLTEKEIEKARKELHETEEKMIRKLQELRDKLANDKDINCRTDTPYLLRYLRIRKYDITRAYQNIKDIHAFKKKIPETTYIPPNIEQLLNLNILRYLPYTDRDGNILFFLDVERWNIQETSFKDILHIFDKICNMISMNPRIQVNGCVAVWNTKGFSIQHLTSIMSTIGPKGFIFYVLIHLIGSDMNELHKHVNPALLPKQLGGSLDDNYSVTQNVLDNISYIKYDNTFI